MDEPRAERVSGTEARRRGQALLDMGRDGDALAHFTQALSAAPDDSNLLANISHAHFKLGQLGKSRQFAERAIEADPNQEWGHRLRAHSLLGMQSRLAPGSTSYRESALQSAQEAVRLEPRGRYPLYTLVQALLACGRTIEARAAAERLLSMAPEWNLSHQAIALAAIRQRRWVEVEHHCREELKIDPNSWAAMNNLGLALRNTGRRREALACFFRAVRLNPTGAIPHSNLYSNMRGLTWAPFVLAAVAGFISLMAEAGIVAAVLIAAVTYVAAFALTFLILPSDVKEHLLATAAGGKVWRLPLAVGRLRRNYSSPRPPLAFLNPKPSGSSSRLTTIFSAPELQDDAESGWRPLRAVALLALIAAGIFILANAGSGESLARYGIIAAVMGLRLVRRRSK